MRIKHFLVVAFMFVAAMATAQQMPTIPVDKNVRIGKLPNGLTYYIRHNEWPEHVANFYIAQRVGSIQENEDQRGLAHFLEHMAFNGSEHFPDSTLLEFTRGLGVEFGSNLNAYTSIDQTVYRVCDVPTKRQSALDSCVLILKDWSNGLTLAGSEIDKERGVIHQEWQLRSSAGQRIFERVLPRLYPGSKYGVRLPIGLMSVVDNFKYKELRDYYHKWYRPDNQAIIIVGDVDVDHMENLIKELWKDATVPANAAQVKEEPVPDNDTAIYVFDKDKEMPYSQISIAMKHDPMPDEMKSNPTYYMMDYMKSLISMMFNQRLREATLKADCPFTSAYGYDGEYIYSKTKDAFQIEANAKDGRDLDALKALYREAQRVRQFGFTQGEFDRSKAEILSQYEDAYNNRNKIRNSQFGDEYRDNYLDHDPIPGIEWEYQFINQIANMPQLGLETVNKFAKELITDNDTNLVVTDFAQEKAGKTYPTEAEMADAVKAVRAEKLTPYVDNAKNEPIVDEKKLPKAGKIKSEKDNKQLGFKVLTLSNGAKVVLKHTDFKQNDIVFYAEAKGGKSLYGPADYLNVKYLNNAVAASGFGNFSNSELQKALYGKQVSISSGISNFWQTLNGSTTPKDLETLMQLVYLRFTGIQKDQESYDAAMQRTRLALQNKDLTPEAVFSDSLQNTIYGHNPRFAPQQASDLDKISYDRMLQIYKERFANAGQFTFYFVGNFDEAKLRPLIEKYIACLPAGKKENFKEITIYPDGNATNKFSRKMETPKAIAFDFMHMPMAYNVDNSVLADAAGQVLSMVYLKQIREDASAAYSVGAYGGLTMIGTKSIALMQDYCPMDPNKVDQATGLLVSGLKECAVKVDADKVQKVKEFMLKQADEDAKDNSHWLDILSTYVNYGVDFQTGYKQAVNALTPERIAAYLKSLSAAGNHASVVMTPQK
ncbi:M16 family metallopeptidase [Prevotella lacticifex]|nr:M16 family metallopeptidase [Prevotella lacticifex]